MSFFTKTFDKAVIARLARPFIHRLLDTAAERLSKKGFGDKADWLHIFDQLEEDLAAELVGVVSE